MRYYLYALVVLSAAHACNPSPQRSNQKEQDSASATGGNSKVSLPEPYATKSSINFCKVLGWGNRTTPKAPQGFSVAQYGGDLQNPRWIYVLPNGDVLVAEAKKGSKGLPSKISGESKAAGESENVNRITLLRDTDRDGKPDVQRIFLADLNMPFGMCLLGNHFYVANTDGVWRYPYTGGETSITAKGTRILTLPDGGHWTRNIITNPDGSKLYVSVGSLTNIADKGMDNEKRRACILEINPDGTGERVYASGLRNPVGMAWTPGSQVLWTVVNERDELGDELVPDYLTSVQEEGFYGWPYSYFGQHIDPRISEKDQHPELVKKAIVPEMSLGAHTSCLGLAFYDQKTFPERYRTGAFIGMHGSWNRSQLSGYKVIFVPFRDGKPSGEIEDFLTGFIADKGKSEVYGRPVGVAVLPDGSLLVADDAGNKVWRVSYSAK